MNETRCSASHASHTYTTYTLKTYYLAKAGRIDRVELVFLAEVHVVEVEGAARYADSVSDLIIII